MKKVKPRHQLEPMEIPGLPLSYIICRIRYTGRFEKVYVR